MFPAHPTAGDCHALGEILERVGNKWTVAVVGTLAEGPMRFNLLRRQLANISQRMLTLTLRVLERDGLVTRTVYPSVPPRVDYALTPLGHTLVPLLRSLGAWARDNRPAITAARAVYDADKMMVAATMPD